MQYSYCASPPSGFIGFNHQVADDILDGMQLAVFGKPLDGSDIASGNCGYRYLTGGNRLFIYQHRTGATKALTTTEFGAGQPPGQFVKPKEGVDHYSCTGSLGCR